MKSDQKKQNIKLKPNKKVLKKPKENEFETTSMSYFRILKELEKQNAEQKLAQELKKKEYNPKKTNLTEVIYENNSKKLGNYYNKNQNDLLLYGSSKYDILSMDKLLQEMGNYKSKVINKINRNKNKNVEIKDILQDYKGGRNKEILTPLAENEKESEMEMYEKKNYDEAKRIGVVMRRIEYTSLLNKRNKNGENKEMLTKLRNSAKKIENYWLRHRENVKRKNNERRGHIEIQYLSKSDNIKKLEELQKNYEELNKLYTDIKNEVERLTLENKDLQMVVEQTNKNYNDLLTEKNNLQDNYDKLLEEKNSLTDKYNELIENLNQKEEELNNIKNEYEILSNTSKLNEETIKKLEEAIENINNEKNEFENQNNLLKNSIIDLENKNKDLESVNNDLNKLKEENENEINKLNEEKNEKDNEINKLNEEKEEKDNEINKLNEEKTEMGNEINKLKEEKEEKENEIKKLNEEKEEKEKQLNELKEEKENEINKLNEEKTEMENAINKLNEEKTEMGNQINKLTEENTEKDNEINKLKEEKVQLENDINGLKEDLIEKGNEINKLTEENNQKDKEIEQLNQEKDDKDKQINILNQEKEDKDKEISQLNQDKDDKDKEIAQLNDLRELLGIAPNEYPRWNNFKTRVLDSCQQALKEITDISFEYERGKVGNGGKWLTIIFTISKNEPTDSQMVLFEQDLENHINLKALQSDEGIMPNKDDSNNNNDISSDIEFYMVACNNEFTVAQTESILSIINSMELPEHEMGIVFAKYHYLEEQYSRFNAYSEQHTIINRYSYFYTMLISERDKQRAGEGA